MHDHNPFSEPWSVRDRLAVTVGTPVESDRRRSERAAHRYALRQALAERSGQQDPRPGRRHWWRRGWTRAATPSSGATGALARSAAAPNR